MKHHLSILTLILLLTASISKAQDYVWGEEFKEGDVISATTFNQIFDTLEKLNRTAVDADLIGTWSCTSASAQGNLEGVTGWIANGVLQKLDNIQVTLTSSGSNSSFISPYSISTSTPNPILPPDTGSFTGTYSVFNNQIWIKPQSAVSYSSTMIYDINIISKNRFILSKVPSSTSAGSPVILCDSAVAVPAAPSATTATNAQTLVNVTWTDNSTDETGFKIYRRLSNATEATELATAVTASPYVDSTLTEGQTAYYSVAAYNDNGVSAKSKVVSATLDSIKPSVVSTSPAANQAVARTNRQLSINFSENVNAICPATGKVEDICNTSGSAITATGNSGKTYGYITTSSYLGTSVAGDLFGPSGTFDASDIIITITVHKEWIQDLNGNPMDADYTYTFTTGS